MALEKREERVKRRKDPKSINDKLLFVPLVVSSSDVLSGWRWSLTCQSFQEEKGSLKIPSHDIDKHRPICILNPLSEKMGLESKEQNKVMRHVHVLLMSREATADQAEALVSRATTFAPPASVSDCFLARRIGPKNNLETLNASAPL